MKTNQPQPFTNQSINKQPAHAPTRQRAGKPLKELFKVVGNELRRGKDYPEVTEKNALALSIKKWQFIVAWLKEAKKQVWDGCYSTCALCRNSDSECTGCLVAQRTGEQGCEGTPYWDYATSKNLSKAMEAAKAELAFLKSLRGGRK